MQTATPMTMIPQITECLYRLPGDRLQVVYDFVSYLVERSKAQVLREKPSEPFQMMLASEPMLRRDWDRPEEDKAWADL